MAVDLSWPEVLPLPTMAGYGIEDDHKIARTEMEVGAARERRTSTQLASRVTVEWRFTVTEFAIFEAWLRYRAAGQWFAITYLGGVGLIECEARLRQGKAPAKFANGALVSVTAELDVRDRPMMDEATLDLMLTIGPGPLFSTAFGIHHIVHYELDP